MEWLLNHAVCLFSRTTVLSAMEWLLNHENDDDIDEPIQLVEDLHVSPVDITEVLSNS